MTSFNSKLMENGKTIDHVLLDVLQESEIIKESTRKKIGALSYLEESRVPLEESAKTPDSTNYLSTKIDRIQFAAAYSNVRGNTSARDVMLALGVPSEDIGGTKDDSINRALNRMVDHFNKMMNPNDPTHEEFPKLGNRNNHYLSRERGGIPEPTMDSIDGGSRAGRNRTTATIDKINREDLLDGEFYSNMTRIPKTRWSSWLKFWDRSKSSVRKDRSKIGRQWKKTFMLGYYVGRNVFYEIWYNSLDSTFTVHDRGGIEMSARVVSMTEAVRDLIRLVVQESDRDRDFFAGTTPDAQRLSNSVTRALTSSADARADALMRADQREADRERKSILRYEQKIKERQQKQERVKQAALEIAGDVKTAARDANATGKKLFKSGAQGLIELIKNEYDLNKPTAEKVAKSLKKYVDDLYTKNRKQWNESPAVDQAKTVIQAELGIGRARAEQVLKDIRKAYGVAMNLPADIWTHGVPNDNDPFNVKKNRDERYKRLQGGDKQFHGHMDDVIDAPDAAKQNAMRDRNIARRQELEKQLRDKQRQMDLNLSESTEMLTEQEEFEQILDDVSSQIQGRSYDRDIERVRNQAERHDQKAVTQQLLRQNVVDDVVGYDRTRVEQSFIRRWFDNTITSGSILNIFMRGRTDKIRLPTDRPSLWQRAKMSVKGTHYRADFVSGWSYMGRINIEIWYVTEPNPNYSGGSDAKMIASFYVFDVTSGQIIRRFLPHYRNALQVALGKLVPIAGRTN